MKKIVLLFTALFLVLVSCKENGVPKPKKMIDRNQMIDVIYDLAILESAKSQSMVANSFPKSNDFIKKAQSFLRLFHAVLLNTYKKHIIPAKKHDLKLKNFLYSKLNFCLFLIYYKCFLFYFF